MINRAVRKYIYIIVKFVKSSIRYILRYSFDWEKIIGRRIPWEGIKEIGIEISRVSEISKDKVGRPSARSSGRKSMGAR